MCGDGTHHHPHRDAADLLPAGPARVVVAGKGGVGKSTLTALAALTLARAGRSVVAVDADEQMNLAATLGVGGPVVPVAQRRDYVAEKTGAAGSGGLLRLDPAVDDVLDRLAVPGPDGLRLLVMGGVRQAAGGCLCPEHTVLAAVVAALGPGDGDVVLMDTHAGVEHFGRALARGFDRALVVTDPTANATQVAVTTARLAADLGIGTIHLAVNRVRDADDARRAGAHLAAAGGFPFGAVHLLPFDPAALDTEPAVAPLLGGSPLALAVQSMVVDLLAPVPALQEA